MGVDEAVTTGIWRSTCFYNIWSETYAQTSLIEQKEHRT